MSEFRYIKALEICSQSLSILKATLARPLPRSNHESHPKQRRLHPRASKLLHTIDMYTRLLLPAAIVLLWTQIACGKAIEPRATPFASAEPTSAPTDTPNSFRVLNFFSYDQAVATLKHPAPKGTTQQDTFVQFIFDDNEIGPNGGCQFAWDPSSNEKPPVGKTVVCEFDADKTATLKSYKGPGDFVIDLVHK